MPDPSILSRLTLLAERIAPALARIPKTQRATLSAGTWGALDHTIAAIFDALSDPTNAQHRHKASARFDLLKWYLRLLVQQRAVSPGWHAALMPDLVAVGKVLGGMQK